MTVGVEAKKRAAGWIMSQSLNCFGSDAARKCGALPAAGVRRVACDLAGHGLFNGCPIALKNAPRWLQTSPAVKAPHHKGRYAGQISEKHAKQGCSAYRAGVRSYYFYSVLNWVLTVLSISAKVACCVKVAGRSELVTTDSRVRSGGSEIERMVKAEGRMRWGGWESPVAT